MRSTGRASRSTPSTRSPSRGQTPERSGSSASACGTRSAPRQRLERLLPMAGFEVSTYGRFWVSTEAEDGGFATILIRDHFIAEPFGHQLAPLTALATVAAVTRRLRIGSL